MNYQGFEIHTTEHAPFKYQFLIKVSGSIIAASQCNIPSDGVAAYRAREWVDCLAVSASLDLKK